MAGLIILIAFIFIFIIMIVPSIKDEICLGKCKLHNVTCNQNDNNCVGGNHYCYDLCVGGISRQPRWFG